MRTPRIVGAIGACAVLLLASYFFLQRSGSGLVAEPIEAGIVDELPSRSDVGTLPVASALPADASPAPIRNERTAREAIPQRELSRSSRGVLEVPLLEVPAPLELEVAGDISGRLVSEKGYWLEAELPDRDTLIVELVRLEEPRLELRADLVVEALDLPGVEQGQALSFLFEAVPVGEYELSLFNLGAWHWEPASMRVRAPAAGLDFVRYDHDELLPLRFEVFDASSGERIEEFRAAHLEQSVSEQNGVFMHAGPLDTESFPNVAHFQWSVWAEGYRPSFGDERSFRERDGRRVARVELRPGWAARLVVLGREPTLRPLFRAGVRIDGRYMGATDREGALVVELDEAPERIEVLYKGWGLENDPFDPRPGTTAELRGHVVPLILRAPR